MLPKIHINEKIINKEQIASNIIQQDFVRSMMFKSKNQSYKRLKEAQCPLSAESPFGDFPAYMKENHGTRLTGKITLKDTFDPYSDISRVRTLSLPRGSNIRPRTLGIKTVFRDHFDRGVIPIKVLHGGSINKIQWTTDPTQLDLKAVFPVFVDGLREKIDPYRFLAILGSFDIIEKASVDKLLETIPLIVQPLKLALNTRDLDIISVSLKFLLKLLTTHPEIGKYLVPYYRQLLPIFNIMKDVNKNLHDKMEYNQRKGLNIGDLITETLHLMETTGGDDAFINIKYMVPTYESCIYL
jgi:hypothetical protein